MVFARVFVACCDRGYLVNRLPERRSNMRGISRFRAFAIQAAAIGFAITLVGCGGPPPTADVDSAKAAVDKAASDGAGRYAADSLKTAEDARAALDAELQAQDSKWIKSYDKTKELAAAATAAGNKAAADALAGKQKADALATKQRAEAARAKAKAAAVKVGGNVKSPTKVKDVPPVYPEIAKSARVSGAVVIEATIGQDGKVVDTKVVHSVPLLDEAAVDAVRQWEYTPALLNGAPVPVLMTVTVNFARR
jgi:protein TonB